MSFGKAAHFIFLFAAFYVIAGATAAYGGTCSSISLTVQTVAGGATVTGSAGVFSVSLGSVNGLGIGTPAAGVSKSIAAGGTTYTTPVKITVTYAGCSSSPTATVKVYQDSTTSANSKAAARGGSSAASVIAIPTSLATATTISTTTSGSGDGTATFTRYVGVFVSKANGASRVTGALAPKFIYNVNIL
jgi:hypothetical protein